MWWEKNKKNGELALGKGRDIDGPYKIYTNFNLLLNKQEKKKAQLSSLNSTVLYFAFYNKQ